ncbi:MAG: hypothetical protein CL853_08365 [Crocinitomicaceae bacterium]|nr:hypothetical protein [Crocinitomicaceae bacterium]
MTASIILNGILFGLLLSFLFGPAFFILIDTSIKKGFKQALFLDIGILLSDVLYLFAAYLFAEKINAYLHENLFIKLAAGIAFIVLGIVYVLKKQAGVSNKPTVSQNSEHQKKSYVGLIAKGIGLNAINPGVLIYWIAACTYATETLELKDSSLFYYFTSTIITLFGVDLIKIYFASKLKSKLTVKTQAVLKNIIGIGLITFGILMFFKAF